MGNLLSKKIEANIRLKNNHKLFNHPWWMYPNLYSLDAPIVAITWQWFFVKIFNIPISLPTTLVLALTVWVIYLLDHLLDAKSGENLKERHLFTKSNKNFFVILIFFILIGITLGCFYLSNIILLSGIILGLFICFYFCLVHIKVKTLVPKLNVKELLVGIGFGLGVALPIITSPLSIFVWVSSVVIFSLLCWLNCRLIEIWESKSTRLSRADLLLIIILVVGHFFIPAPISIAVSLSLLGFILIWMFSDLIKPCISRVLADFILLTPILVVLIL